MDIKPSLSGTGISTVEVIDVKETVKTLIKA